MGYGAAMSTSFKAACIQNSATPDVTADIATCLRLIGRAAEAGARFIALPEYCIGLDTKDGLLYPLAYPERDHRRWFLCAPPPVMPQPGSLSARSA